MRDKSLDSLNPEFRAKVHKMMKRLAGSKWNWKVFETFRQPVNVYKKSKVSKSNPFTNPSKHGYGWAVDVVPNGSWAGPWKSAGHPAWAELRAAAHAVGLDNDIKWDRPHVEASRATMVKALQRKLGIKDDGVWGSKTTAAAKAAAISLGVQWMTPVPTGETKIHPTTYRALYAAAKGSAPTTGDGVAIVAGAGAAVFIAAGVLIVLGRRG